MNTTKPTKVIVLGGGYAGTLAALRLAGKSKGQAVEVILVNGQDHFVERIRHHQLASGQSLPKVSFAKLLAGSTVRFVQGWCTQIALADKQIVMQSAAGVEPLAYDYLIYALGSTVETGRVPGVADYAYTLGDEATSTRLQEQARRLAAKNGQLLIVGGGLTGIEAATELAESYPGLRVTLATKGKLGATLSTAGAAHVQRVFARLGIAVQEETTVEWLTPNAAHCTDGRVLSFDACLWAGSFVVPKLAAAAGLPVDHSGRVLVDEHLRVVNQPTIYAAGDVAATPLRMACATAMPMGAYVADQVAAQIKGEPTPAPFQFSYLVQCISLGRHNGLVQFVHADDAPQPRIITGWAAARIKELICRFTVWSLYQEKRWPGLYAWPKAHLALGNQPTEEMQPKRSLAVVGTTEPTSHEVHYGQTAANL